MTIAAPSVLVRRALSIVGASALIMGVSACGGDAVDDAADQAASTVATSAPVDDGAPVTDSTPAGVGDEAPADDASPAPSGDPLDVFCERAAVLRVPVERPFVGSAEHVEMWDDIAEVAPADLREDIETMSDHFEFDVDPSDPDSQDFVNFPAHIQDTALALDEDISERCDNR